MTPIEKIRAERKRQIEVEGWSAVHDDEHTEGSILAAARCYHLTANWPDHGPRAIGRWPWARKGFKPKGREADLVRSGALALAEKDRALRIIDACDEHLNLIVAALDHPTELSK